MVLLILIGAMLLVGVPLYIHYRMSGSPSANAPMPRAQSSWHHHHPTSKAKSHAQSKGGRQTTGAHGKGNDKEVLRSNPSIAASTSSQGSQTAQTVKSAQSTQNAQEFQNFENKDTAPSSELAQAPEAQSPQEETEVCCGLHEVCEKLSTNPTKIEYFDDEELDVFAGRDPEDYNDREIDQFRDVMTTMYPSEVALWRQSLQLRGVALPVELEDEFMLILSEV